MKINRRDFVKVGVLGTIAAPVFGSTSSHTSEGLLFADSPEFLNVFKKMDYTHLKFDTFTLKSPLDNTDDIFVKPYTQEANSLKELQGEFNKDACLVLLAAGTDNNVIIYDNKNNTDYISIDLLFKMNVNMFDRSKKRLQSLTDIFYREGKISKDKVFANKYHQRFHPIKHEVWDYIESYYKKELQACLPNNKKNLVIGVTTEDNNHSLIHAIQSNPIRTLCGNYKQEAIIASLDNKRIILGAF